jgi:hypothetical protein
LPTCGVSSQTASVRRNSWLSLSPRDLEAKLQAPFNRFSDTLAADEVELNFKYIIQVSLHRRLFYAGRPPVKSAILATDSTMIHYGRLHAVLTQGSSINVRIVQDRERLHNGSACRSNGWQRRAAAVGTHFEWVPRDHGRRGGFVLVKLDHVHHRGVDLISVVS